MEWIKLTQTFWKPTLINDEIIGTVVSIEPTEFGDTILISTESTGFFLLGMTVLVPKLKKLIGQTVRIVYLGDKTSAKGRTYKNFDVYILDK